MQARGEPLLVIDERAGIAESLRAEGVEVILGNTGQTGLLEAANLAQARRLVSCLSNPGSSPWLMRSNWTTFMRLSANSFMSRAPVPGTA